jgi:hypothetical protein
MTDEKRDRPTLPTRRAPRPAPDRGRDPIDVPMPASTELTPDGSSSSRVSAAPPTPKREVTVQLGTRVNERTKDLLDHLKVTQRQDIRASIEIAIEEKYGHLLPRDN